MNFIQDYLIVYTYVKDKEINQTFVLSNMNN